MKSHTTWMPFYIGDYLRDTSHLSALEHGGYLLLLMHAWTHDGVLPTDDVRLRNIAKMSVKDWGRSSATLRAFFTRDGDALRNPRIDRELAKTSNISEQRRAAGRASAAARAAQQKTNETPTSVDPPLEQTGRPSQSPLEKERILPKVPPSAAAIPARSAPLDSEFETFWHLYPRKTEGPGACRKQWAKARKEASGEAIIAGLRRYPFKPDFLPMAATWLNQKRWLTEPDTPLLDRTTASGDWNQF